MANFFNIEIVGTSHISPESKRRILSSFNSIKPSIICVELDRERLQGLRAKNRKGPGLSSIKHIGVTGYLFALIGGFIQRKLGNLTGMMPGEELLLGVSLAEKNNLRLELIDLDVRLTLRKLRRMPFREKMRLVWDILRAPFQRKRRVKIDIKGIPEESLVLELISQLKSRYPYLYKVIIHDRNKFMAKKLFVLSRENPSLSILAIVGEGHTQGLISELKRLDDSNVSFIKQ
jgi:pheromone shutdown protein TraB